MLFLTASAFAARTPSAQDLDVRVERLTASTPESLCLLVTLRNKTNIEIQCDLDAVEKRLLLWTKGSGLPDESGIEGSVVRSLIKSHSVLSKQICVKNFPTFETADDKLQYSFLLVINYVNDGGKPLTPAAVAVKFIGDVKPLANH